MHLRMPESHSPEMAVRFFLGTVGKATKSSVFSFSVASRIDLMAERIETGGATEWVHWARAEWMSMTLDQKVAALYEELRMDVYRYLLTVGLPAYMAQEIAQDCFVRLYETMHAGTSIEN